MCAAKMLALFQRIDRAAIWALALAGASHIQKHPGRVTVNGHVRFGAGAVHAALSVQVGRQQFDVG